MIDIEPGMVLGKYRVEDPIGGGGFARVYRADQMGPGGFSKKVAIKILRQKVLANESSIERFFREARILALLNHRNIVQVHEFTQERGLYFLVMEYVEGLTLSRLSRELGREIPLWLQVAIGVEVCRALRFAHGLRDRERQVEGIMHRDIKPSNIMISSQGDVKVTDFGLAKMSAGDNLSVLGEIKGTPRFMSPEQREGAPTTVKSDIYSLASVLYALCTGEAPNRFDEGEIPPASRLDPEVPEALSLLLARALSSRPEQRPDAATFGEQLQQILERVAPPGQLSRLSDALSELVRRCAEGLAVGGAGRGGQTASVAPGARPVPFAPQIVAGEGGLSTTRSPGAPAAGPRGAGPAPERADGPTDGPTIATRRGRLWRWTALFAGVAVILLVVDALVIRPQAGPVLDRGGGGDAGQGRRGETSRGRGEGRAAAPPSPVDGSPGNASDARAAPPPRPVVKPRHAATRRRGAGRRTHSPRGVPSAAEPRGEGFLSLNVEPWATVFVDDKKVGVTPIYRMRLRAGTHRIRLRGPEGREVTRRVRIRPDKHENLGLVLLE
jgi:serine/threonine-protein kinase